MSAIFLLGHPNSGKTQLFNALTDNHAAVGNWSGVTIDAQTATYPSLHDTCQLIDLPGIYSLYTEPTSTDEKITLHHLNTTQPALILHVIHACQLERHLFLTSELLALHIPLIVVLTMSDIATKRGIHIDPATLASVLGCPVFAINAQDLSVLAPLKQTIQTLLSHPTPPEPPKIQLPTELTARYQHHLQANIASGAPIHQAVMTANRQLLSDPSNPDTDLILADAHYQYAHTMCLQAQTTQQERAERWTARLDRFFLHRVLGLPIFFMIMYALFFFAIHIGGLFQDFFDLTTQAICVQLPTLLLQTIHSPPWLITLIAEGAGKGLNTTLTFIPVLAAMYFFLSFLENSGYMTRAAFIMDRAMRVLGLPGKAFVPLIIGFGCNVPAILATRTLEKTRDRTLTALMAPFMSCSARLTIYTVFVSTFFPSQGQNVIFALYLLGILIAILTGFILRRSFLSEALSPLILELPTYHPPNFRQLRDITWFRLCAFLKRAAKLIVPTCLMLSAVQLIQTPSFLTGNHPQSLLSYAGQLLYPLFAPMGLTPDNWPAVVGLVTGFLAKEVVIGTMNALYQQLGDVMPLVTWQSIFHTLSMGVSSIIEHFSTLWQSLFHPFMAQVNLNQIPIHFHLFLQHYFHDIPSVYAYLTFILLYLPCISTMAAIKQETTSTLMWFSMGWSFFIAYSVSVALYQLMTFHQHPLTSIEWLCGILIAFFGFVIYLRATSFSFGGRHAIPSP
ncbi:MAG: ferrous iron transport protein B [Gammaproteobacteria bacterium]|nr:ferrous iron transport protein B [Gammaproteobacteria bacterium]